MRTAMPFALLATALTCSPAAAATETWVSGTSGKDSNTSSSCQPSAPCATFSAALTVTSPGGTIFCADPPLNIGPLTISEDVTIECNGGAVPASGLGGNGININTAGVNVTLRGLSIYGVDGPVSPQPIGIDITAAAVVRVEHCKIYGFATAGVEIEPSAGNISVKIQDSTITKNASGVLIAPTGGASVVMSVEQSQIENSTGGGLKAAGSGGPITLSVSESTISQNGANGLNAVSSSSNVMVNLSRDVIASNGLAGVQANGGNAAVTVDNTSILNNATALSAVGGGRILTYGTNRIVGNAGTGFSSNAPLQ